MEKKEIHRLRLSNSVNETSYRKLNNIIDKLKSQRDFYKNELDLIKEEKGENEPMDG
jgi:molybdopterin synthase catalytic subunit